jgi:hypothetical protein
MSRLLVVFPLLAGAAVIGAPATAQQAPRACTSAELQRSEVKNGVLPYSVFEGSTRVERALRTRTEHHFEVTPAGNVIAESIVVVGPSGALSKVPGARAVTFALTTGAAGSIPLKVSWEQELVTADGIPTGARCAGSGTATLTVRSPNTVRLTAKATSARYELGVRRGSEPSSRSRVIYEIRVRRGSTKPPSLRGAPLARYLYTADTLGPLTGSDTRSIRGVGQFLVLSGGFSGPNARGRMLLVPGTVPAGQKRRFGFSIRVLQGGKVAGGLRGGAVCRGATRASLRCTQTVFVGNP